MKLLLNFHACMAYKKPSQLKSCEPYNSLVINFRGISRKTKSPKLG